MHEKWGVRCGWIKVHAAIAVETNQIPGLEVTDEAVPDDRMSVPLLDRVQQPCGEERPVCRVPGDGAYDRNEPFNALEQRKILAGIKTRTDAATRSTGSPYHVECGRERIQVGDIGCGRGQPPPVCGGRAKGVSPP